MKAQEIQQIGRYRVLRFIAEGGMAWVFEVVDPTFDRHLALKMLKPEAAAGDEYRRFKVEAEILAGVNHPNLVTLFDLGKDEATGCYFYTMTLVDGPSLAQRGVLPYAEAVPIIIDALNGLARLHDRGVIHRDVKPANILLQSDSLAVLSDLGIARVSSETSVTRTRVAMGTVRYMSPEQALGTDVGPPSDVFAMGLSLFEVLAGHSVYRDVSELEGNTGEQILFYLGALTRAGEQLSFEFPADVPRAIRNVVLRACRLAPGERYRDAREMRDALEQAWRGGARHPRPWNPKWLAAGTALLLALGGGGWLLNRQLEQRRVQTDLEQVLTLKQSAEVVIAKSRALIPPLPSDSLTAFRTQIDVSAIYIEGGARSLADGDYQDALAFFHRSSDGLTKACGNFSGSVLAARADGVAREARARAEELVDAGLKEIRPDQWQQLETVLGKLEPPAPESPACAAANRQLERMAVSDGVVDLVAVVSQALRSVWPKMAEQARDAALAEQAKTAALEVTSPDFVALLEAGGAALREGDLARDKEDHLRARRAYRRAQDSLRTAVELAPALQARERALALRTQTLEQGIEDLSLVENFLSAGQAAYEQERWLDAETEYTRAADVFQSVLNNAMAARAALAAAEDAQDARQAAIAEGADGSANLDFTRAEKLFSSATEALEDKLFAAAERDYREARDAYAASSKSANQLLLEARNAQGQAKWAALALLKSGDCNDLAIPAQPACGRAQESMQLGESWLAKHSSEAAIAAFIEAERWFREAEARQSDYVQNRPQAPYLIRREPIAETLRGVRGEQITFAIEAEDPNPGDQLRYRWSVDGVPVAGTSNTFDFQVARDAIVRVRVEDGHGGSIGEVWNVAVANSKPTLELSPSEKRVQLNPGEELEFHLAASDPDGEQMTLVFLVDGKTVATGATYYFRAERPGTYHLEARATDVSGASTQITREIRVAAPVVVARAKPVTSSLDAERPDPKDRVTARIEPPAQPSDSRIQAAVRVDAPAEEPSDQPVRDAALAALHEYEAAYEARDLDRLSSVWMMSSTQRKAMAGFFKNMTMLQLRLSFETPQVREDGASIDFDQEISGEAKHGDFPIVRTAMTATLIRDGDDWVISAIRPR